MAGELSWLERGTHKPEVSGSESFKHSLNCKLL